MYSGLHVNNPLFLSNFNDTEFSQHVFAKIYKISNFKIRLVGAELFHASEDRQKHDEAMVTFRNSANRRNKT